MNVLLLKKIDRMIGSFLIRLCPRTQQPGRGALLISRLLLIRPGGIGDAVLLVPIVQYLKETFPEATIDVLAEKRNAKTFKMCPQVDKVLLYDHGGLLTVLRSRYDVVIDTEQWHRLTAVVTRMIRAQIKIGYGTNERKKLYTHVVSYSHDRNELDSFYDLLRPLGLEESKGAIMPFLKVPNVERATVDHILCNFAEHSYITLFPGASIRERRWEVGKFHDLAIRLNGSGYPVVVVGGKEDFEAGEKILSGADGLNLAGKTTLVESAAVVQKSLLLVSGDSGMLHIGVGLDKPTVSLFGSGIAAKWAPRGDRHVVLNKKLPCSPCTKFGYTPPCPIDAQCLREITVEDVLTAVKSLLK